MKVPISILRRLNIILVLHFDEILSIASPQKQFIIAKYTLIFLLQTLGFLVNIEKSVLQPCKRIEFFEIIMYSRVINFVFPQKKKASIMEQCQLLLSKGQISVRENTELIG